jgi:hypothetical protein
MHGKILAQIDHLNDETLASYFGTAKDNILATEDGIVGAPGGGGKCYLVMQQNTPRPGLFYTVTVSPTTGRISCDKKCHYFAVSGICPEIIAVSIKLDIMQKYVTWMNIDERKSFNQGNRLDRLLKVTMPSKPGTKHQAATSRRKGSMTRLPKVTSLLTCRSAVESIQPSTSENSKRQAGSSNAISTKKPKTAGTGQVWLIVLNLILTPLVAISLSNKKKQS